MQYTVQKGDTLSGIGGKYGVDWGKITGYSSGNPGLIRPGEVLTLPDAGASKTTFGQLNAKYATPKPKPATQAGNPVLAASASLSGISPSQPSGAGGSVEDYQRQILDLYQNQEDPVARFNRLKGETGISGQEDLVTTIAKKILDTSGNIEQVDPNVTNRVKPYLVNEADRQAMVATERKPQEELLRDLLKSKEREDVNLSTKYNYLNQLLRGEDERMQNKVKPLELALGFAADNRKYADQLALTTAKQAKSGSAKAVSTAAKAKKQYTDDVWNKILGSSGIDTIDDVATAIQKVGPLYAKRGADVDQLWSKYYALRAKKGQGASLRESDGYY